MKSHYKSVRYVLNTLYHASIKSAKYREDKGRTQAGEHDIDLSYLEGIWQTQNGRCYYSNIPMNYNKNEWRISLERLDTNEGYVKGNVVLCCLEFNTRCQWSHTKIENLLHLLQNGVEKVETDFTRNKDKREKYNKFTISLIDGQDVYKCSYCEMFKTKDAFCRNQLLYCKNCLTTFNRNKTPKQHFKKIIHAAKSASKTRKCQDIYPERGVCSITFEDLIEMYNAQNGLCAYSGIPLQFGSYKDKNWVASLERLNPLKGYTKDNVCLICLEFNSADQTVKTGELYGNAGWTQLKFDYFIAHIEHKKGLISDDELQAIIDIQQKYKDRQFDKQLKTYKNRKSEYIHQIQAITKAKREYGIIYTLKSPSGKTYVGATDVLLQEKHTIFYTHRINKYKLIIQELECYNEDEFEFERIASCRKDKLEELKEHIVMEFNTQEPNGLNCKKRIPKETCKQISDTLISINIRYGHSNQELPKHVKFHNWADRMGYSIISHPKCKKKDFVSKKKSLDELYKDCMYYLSTLNDT